MKKPKMTPYGDYAKWIRFPVMANYHVRLVITDDLTKSGKERLGKGPLANSDAFCSHIAGEGMSYLFLKHDSTEGTVAHECWHIVYRMFTWCGVQDFEDELTAYHISHMVEAVYEFKNEIKSSTKKEVSDDKSVSGASGKKCD